MKDNQHILMKIGNLVREIRLAHGYNQSDLKSAGINRTLLYRVETGKYNISLASLVRILDFYDISLSQFADNQSGYFNNP